ncbi:MAG: hypothetical protein ABSG89_07610 [Bacteroidales bacterium]|jgi:hypothetical protein
MAGFIFSGYFSPFTASCTGMKPPLSGRKCVMILAALFMACSHCLSQVDRPAEVITETAEDLAEEDSDPGEAEAYAEYLDDLTENPVRINSGSETELSRLFFLSHFQIRALADYITKTGKMVSVYEIPAIPGFDQHIAEMMVPFITLKDTPKTTRDTISVKSTLITNVIIRQAEDDTPYLGSPLKMLSRYRLSAGRFSGGFTAEKDAGEKLLSGSPPLPDFLSAYASFNGTGILRTMIIGDFSVRFGLGTCINTGIRTAMSLISPGYLPGRDNLRPYTSSDENRFLRGTAAELVYKNIGLIMFFSINSIDAALEPSPDSTTMYVKNLHNSGLHNTSRLLKEKDNLGEISYGMSLTYNARSLRTGINWSEARFSFPFKPDKSDPENVFYFEGERDMSCSANYSWLKGKLLLYGEFSFSKSGYALVQAAGLRPCDRLSLNIMFRDYSPGYTAFNGRGPGSTSSTCNEKGILGNFTFEAARHLFVSAGCDIAHYPWLRYRCSFPSYSHREEIDLKYLPSEKISINFTCNFRLSMNNDNTAGGIATEGELRSRTFKLLVRFTPAKNIVFSTRTDYKVIRPSGSRGMLLLLDAYWKSSRLPVSFWMRYCIFSTEGWDSRLYALEDDLLYGFSIPSLSGEGSRSYLMMKWDLFRFAEIRIKYGVTEIIADDGGISGKNDIRFQFIMRF